MDLIRIKELLEKKIVELGYEPISITKRQIKGDTYLEVVIDRVEPIDMNTIVSVSGLLSSYLDEIDDSDEKYFLDISSLGAEKPLKVDNLKSYQGRYVNVHLINPIDGENIYEGDMIEVNEDSITLSYRIKTRVKQINILLNNIYKIRLAIKI